MNNVSYQEINEEEHGQRLDNYLIRVLKGVPKSHIYRIIRSGEVRVNKKRAQVSSRLQTGDRVRIPPLRLAEQSRPFVGSDIEKKLKNCIIYENNQLLVLNKPAGIAVHGGSGISLGIIEALRKIREDIHYLELAHRLDKDTSGCLVLAKKRSVLRAIQALLEARNIKKTYWALLTHRWQTKNTLYVNEPLQKNKLASGGRFVKITEAGKPSETCFKLLENFHQACWVEAQPKTGRTHQIRVHSASIGHAIAGDEKYGSKTDDIKEIEKKHRRLYLHAREIQFNLDGVQHVYQADIDEKFKSTLNLLRTRSLETNA